MAGSTSGVLSNSTTQSNVPVSVQSILPGAPTGVHQRRTAGCRAGRHGSAQLGTVAVTDNRGLAAAVNLSVARTAFSLTGGSGINSASWNPTLSVLVPASAVAGTCTATITHSVA